MNNKRMNKRIYPLFLCYRGECISTSEIFIGLLHFLQDRFLSVDVRVRVHGSEGGRVRVRILEISPTTEIYSDPIITSPCQSKA